MHPTLRSPSICLVSRLAIVLSILAFPILRAMATPVFEPVRAIVVPRVPQSPGGDLVRASDGNFYGTTFSGGGSNYGTVFKMTPGGALTVLVSFTGTNGKYPQGGVVEGDDGNFYGITSEGGSSNAGTVFRMTPAGVLTTLVNFNGSNGFRPQDRLVRANNGNFYGTTNSGGTSGNRGGTVFEMTPAGALTTLVGFPGASGSGPRAPRCGLVQGSDGDFYGTTSQASLSKGTVFKVTPTGALTILITFDGSNGSDPRSGLIQGSDGNFYGTTCGGGMHGHGTVFRMTPAGVLTTLVNFTGTDGSAPWSRLTEGSDGNFYGTTHQGAVYGCGTVFRMTPAGDLTTLVIFDQFTIGMAPLAGLIEGGDGSFYGTTSDRGYQNGYDGKGTVFKMTPSGGLTTLVAFTAPTTTGNGLAAGLARGSDGNFYGTASLGGSLNCGTVFKLTPSGDLTTLLNFTGPNGRIPSAKLVLGSDGSFYGTTASGGSSNGGTAFKMTPAGVLTTLANFTGTNGFSPSGLVRASNGNFYGTTYYGGNNSYGTAFKMTPAGVVTTLLHFTGPNGKYPAAGLVQGGDGNLYGTTQNGGSGDRGTIFKMTTAGVLTTLVHFTGTNGGNPLAELIQGSDGEFYGTTGYGGEQNKGTAFKVTPGGLLTTLVNFSGTNGSVPQAGLVQGSDGKFYGTTAYGGGNDNGTVFRMTSDGVVTTLMAFNETNGRNPSAGLVAGNDGHLYGTTRDGGTTADGQAGGGGQIYRLRMGPGVTTLPVHLPRATEATLNASINPGGYQTTVSFQYGIDPTLTTYTETSPQTLAAGVIPVQGSASISGISAHTVYYFRVLASNAENTVPQAGQILSFTTPTAAEDWRMEHFGSAENSGDGADLNDFDHDGLPNLIEYAFGMDPKKSSAGAMPVAQRIGNAWVMSFTPPTGVGGITYGAEWSPDLDAGNWQAVEDSGVSPNHHFSVPLAGKQRVFMRWKVTGQ